MSEPPYLARRRRRVHPFAPGPDLDPVRPVCAACELPEANTVHDVHNPPAGSPRRGPARSAHRCRSCGAPIRWVTTESGAAMPIDPDLVPRGTVLLTAVKGRGVVARVLNAAQAAAAGGLLHRSHFATCPNARQHRRRRR